MYISAEQLAVSRDPEEISNFTTWYDTVAQSARDLYADLIDILEKWLKLATPFEVYLKTLLSLDNVPNYNVRQGAYSPTYHQKSIISRALQQIEQHGGAFIVAATGLGKTVIGAEVAMRLQRNEKIKRTIFFLPNGVFNDWRRACRGVTLTMSGSASTLCSVKPPISHTIRQHSLMKPSTPTTCSEAR